MNQVDTNVAKASDKLYENCSLLQSAGILATALSDDKTLSIINDAVSLYCTSARVDSAVTAAQRAAEIYRLVSVRLKK